MAKANRVTKPRSGQAKTDAPATQIPGMQIHTELPAVVASEDIIQSVLSSMSPNMVDDSARDAEFNPLNKEQQESDVMVATPEVINLTRVEVPKIRKVVLKKIDRFVFKLGLEKTKERHKIMPGAGHSWAPTKKGNDFLTGLEDKPDIRARLERTLHVDLSSKSSYYASISFRMEDKEHGQIMNFDDPQMGAYYEVIYHSMLSSDLVANGLQQYKSGEKPFAEWYIENKEAEAEMGQMDMTYEIQATNLFPTLSYVRRQEVGKLLGLPVWGTTEKVASMELWRYIKIGVTEAKAFLEVANYSDVEFSVRVLIKTAIKLNVIRRNRSNDYVFNSEILGPTEDHIASRLALATNSTLRLAIERQVNAKS